MLRPVLYYITDRTQFPGDEGSHRQLLLAKIAEATRCGVDYIQLREKDLAARDLENLACEALRVVRLTACESSGSNPRTRLLINSRVDVALAVGADGVHLRSDDISPAVVQRLCSSASARNSKLQTRNFVVGVSCRCPEEVARATMENADFVVFAPVFEKKSSPSNQPAGLDALHQAGQYKIPVLALGGVTLQNATACMEAGAAGIAAIRLFQQHYISEVVAALRSAVRS
jgi:thiamine-phosphate pyrophosphorylase